jgi:hypothetical protein
MAIVLIGCKLPHGLYLDLKDKAGNIKSRAKLLGNANFTLPNPDRKFKGVNTESTFGDTINEVDKDLWDAWIKIHAEHPAILSGAVYMAAKRDDALARAKEHQHENVGFDKLDPKKELVKKMDDKSNPS